MLRRRTALVFTGLLVLVVAIGLLSVSVGAIRIPPSRILDLLTGGGTDPSLARDALVILNIRLPRTLLGLMVGAGLAVSGALMQGLFRNPLADHGANGTPAEPALRD